jgi:hypothetical protein
LGTAFWHIAGEILFHVDFKLTTPQRKQLDPQRSSNSDDIGKVKSETAMRKQQRLKLKSNHPRHCPVRSGKSLFPVPSPSFPLARTKASGRHGSGTRGRKYSIVNIMHTK